MPQVQLYEVNALESGPLPANLTQGWLFRFPEGANMLRFTPIRASAPAASRFSRRTHSLVSTKTVSPSSWRRYTTSVPVTLITPFRSFMHNERPTAISFHSALSLGGSLWLS